MSKTPLADFILTVKVESPERLIWEGKAASVSSINTAGPFDILPDHANMITLIENTPISIHTDAGDKEFTFPRAVISVHDDLVSIFTGIKVKDS